MAITKRLVKGSPLTAAEMDANITEIENASSSLNILSGSHETLSDSLTTLSGSVSSSLSEISNSLTSVSESVSNLSSLTGNISGQFTGSVFVSGSTATLKIDSDILDNDVSTNRVLVHNESTGVVGWSTVSGVSTSGTSGLNGTFFGTNGVDGTNGTAGTSGVDGTNGTAGTSGVDGTNGTAGTSGTGGTSGSGGSSGTNGTSGSGGTSGTSAEGTSGTGGTSGTSGVNGGPGTAGSNGTSGTSSTASSVAVYNGGTQILSTVARLTFDSDTILVTDLGSNEVQIEVIGGGGGEGGGTAGTSGTSGETSSNGTSGTGGTSGTSGTGNPGTNGTSGSGGTTGSSGSDGTDGTSGTGGTSGSNGTDGTGGSSGTSGFSTTLTVKDTGITEISEVRFLQISGSGVTLTTLGDFSASIFFPGASGGSFNSASYEGWITSSQQILEAGFLLSSSANFTDAATRTYGVRATGSSLVYDFIGDVYGPNTTIGARVGDTLIFEVSASEHPFWIKTTPSTGAGSSVTGVTNNGDGEGIVIWDTSAESAGTFYYVSQNDTFLSGEIILGPSLDGNKINGRGLAITGSIGLLGGQSVTGSLVVKGYTNLTGSVIVNNRDISNNLFTLTGSSDSLPYYPNFYSAVSDIQISGSLVVSSSLTASLREGYVWVGGSGSVATLLATSSLGGGAGGGSGIFSETGSAYHTINNVVITGSLEVSGSVTASGFSVNTVGIPRLSSPSNLNLEALGGQVRIVTSSLRLSTFTDAQTSSLIVADGDMIYNSTAGKFMGYANGAWVALH